MKEEISYEEGLDLEAVACEEAHVLKEGLPARRCWPASRRSPLGRGLSARRSYPSKRRSPGRRGMFSGVGRVQGEGLYEEEG